MMKNKIILNSDTKIDIIDIEKVTYITVDSISVEIHLINGIKYHSNKTLTFFETSSPDIFFKINRNTLVNLTFISNINKLTKKISIEGGVVLNVSARQLKNLSKRLKEILIRSTINL